MIDSNHMMQKIHDGKAFSNIDYAEKILTGREFDNCSFTNCNFYNSTLSNNEFIDCSFIECNLSMVKFSNTWLRNPKFLNCKLVGIDFSNCHDFLLSFSFKNCILDYASFVKKKITKTVFEKCIIKEADFSDANLNGSTFIDCDLSGAIFQGTNLEKVDFRSSVNYTIDPELNRIKNARFSITGITGLLSKYDIDIE